MSTKNNCILHERERERERKEKVCERDGQSENEIGIKNRRNKQAAVTRITLRMCDWASRKWPYCY